MRLLVTGASGLIGRHVVACAAMEPAIELIASARQRPSALPRSVAFIAANLAIADEAAALIQKTGPSHIIHCAWETTQPTYWNDRTNLDWVASTARMAETFATSGGMRFVQLGSCAEYLWNETLCIENETPSQPATIYGKAKLAAFTAVKAAARNRFEAVEARIFSVFGPGENPARFIPFICRSHLAGSVPELSSGIQSRDLLYAKDAGNALLMLAAANGVVGVVNIGSGEPTKLSDVAERLARIAGADQTGLGRRRDRPGDPLYLVSASQRIRSTGWKPAYSLDAALTETFNWWGDQSTALET
ncbi:MAG TPA: NAD(P)-dependent oxidoreductase [Allosphingosinicella sp.]|nr:NAD(P)-dependent oxidoreductase [Allosphingosinicella sp.]